MYWKDGKSLSVLMRWIVFIFKSVKSRGSEQSFIVSGKKLQRTRGSHFHAENLDM